MPIAQGDMELIGFLVPQGSGSAEAVALGADRPWGV